jgi:uncharacterized protein
MTLNFNPDGKKTLLSIDGGGMRGVLALALLAELEVMTGKPAYELFDMVGGTSTGAIIAAGLGIHMTAQDILTQVYKDRLPKAFPKQDFSFWLRYVLGGLKSFYPLEPFIEALVPYVKGRKIRDFTSPIVYMTTKDIRTSNTYYVVSAGQGGAAFADWTVSGAVAASGAAPIFFPAVLNILLDGGTGSFANPAFGAHVEAVEYIGWKEEEILHISLGTGYLKEDRPNNGTGSWWLKDWIEFIIIDAIDQTALQQSFVARAVYKQSDIRRYNPLLTRTSIETHLGVPTAGKPDPQVLTLDSIRPEEINFMEEIGRAYARKIDWTQPNVMPWQTTGGHSKPGILPVDWRNTPYQ